MIFTKTQGRTSSNSGYEIKNVAGTYTRAHAPLARKYTNRKLIRVKTWHKKDENSGLY